MRVFTILRLTLSVFFLGGSSLADDPGSGITAILGAFDAEVAILLEAMHTGHAEAHLGLTFVVGELAGRPVVVAETGVGKVNAAMAATLLIEHYRPREVIFTGIAGGLNPELQPGDIVIGRETAQHDFLQVTEEGLENFAPRNPVDGERNPVFLPADPRLLQCAQIAARRVDLAQLEGPEGEHRPQIVMGTIVTGDAFIASTTAKGELRARLGADAVEMEGAAVAQVCHQTGTPCLVIRSLSDEADREAGADLERFYRLAASNSAALVNTIVTVLAEKGE